VVIHRVNIPLSDARVFCVIHREGEGVRWYLTRVYQLTPSWFFLEIARGGK